MRLRSCLAGLVLLEVLLEVFLGGAAYAAEECPAKSSSMDDIIAVPGNPLQDVKAFEQVRGAGSLVVDRSPHGISEGRSHRGHLNLRQVKTGGRTRVRLISKNCG